MLFIPIEFNAIPQLIDQGVNRQAIRSVLNRVASTFTPQLQRLAPVDTGALKRSLRVDILDDEMGVSLTSIVFYAGFVEYGTKRMGARLYATSLVPSIIMYGNDLLSDLGSVTPTPIRQLATGERSNDVVQRVSSEYLDRIQGMRVKGKQIGSVSVPSASVLRATTKLERVGDLSVSGESIINEGV